jgi:hypothetical protein
VRPFLSLLMLVLAVSALSLSALTLWEAYGSGAPYYGRTTNMDKWSNPWPVLGVMNAVTLLACVLLQRWRKRLG